MARKFVVVLYFETEEESDNFLYNKKDNSSYKYFEINDEEKDVIPVSWKLSKELADKGD
jgi:hypothetical protein